MKCESKSSNRIADRASFDSNRISKCVSGIIWFRSGLRREFANHLRSELRVSQNIWFRSGLRSAYRKSFILPVDQNFGADSRIIWFTLRSPDLKWCVNHHEIMNLDQNFGAGSWSLDSDRVFGACLRIIWFQLELGVGSQIISRIEWFTNHAPKSRSETMVHKSLFKPGLQRAGPIIWFRSEIWSGFMNLLIQIGTLEWVCESFHKLNDSRSALWSPDLKWYFRTSEWACESFCLFIKPYKTSNN